MVVVKNCPRSKVKGQGVYLDGLDVLDLVNGHVDSFQSAQLARLGIHITGQ